MAESALRAPGWVRATRSLLRAEVWLVLLLSLIPSALFAVLRLVELLLAPEPLGSSSVALNDPTASELWLDLARRAVRTAANIAPVALAIWLLWDRHRSGFVRLGMHLRTHAGTSPAGVFGRDALRGAALAAAIGIPGLVLYAASRAAGLTVQVAAGETTFRWATLVALVLAAAQAALIEEVIVVGYLATRLRTLGWSVPWIIATSALLRGSYHLYQGVPMAVGNMVMGVVFACAFWYWRDASGRRRLLPLIVAHGLLDAVAFIGYPLATSLWPEVF